MKQIIGLCVLSLAVAGCASTLSSMSGSAPVGADIGNRTLAQKIRDNGIENGIMINLYKLDERFKTNSRVRADAFHDAVLLTGQVPDAHLKTLAGQNAAAIREVKTVHNEISVGAQATYNEIVQDGVLKARITTSIAQNPDLKLSRTKVVVERGVVYAMGILKPEERQSLLSTLEQVPGVVKIVSLIDVIDPNNPSQLKVATGKFVPLAPASSYSNTQSGYAAAQTQAEETDPTPVAVNPYAQIDEQMQQDAPQTQGQVISRQIGVATPTLTGEE